MLYVDISFMLKIDICLFQFFNLFHSYEGRNELQNHLYLKKTKRSHLNKSTCSGGKDTRYHRVIEFFLVFTELFFLLVFL